MGNTFSENQVCECKSPSFVHKRSNGRMRSVSVTRLETNSVHSPPVEQSSNTTGGHSLDESKLDVRVFETKTKTKSKRNKYESRTTKSNDLKTKVSSSSAASGEIKSSKDDKLLLVSLNKLSLDITKNENEVKVKKGPSSEENSVDEELPKHVLYYGWFFSVETSTVIHQIVMHYFRLCFTQVPQFERFMVTCSQDADVRDAFEYYKRPGKRVKPTDDLEYHITAKFLGREPDPSYQTLVHPFLQRTFYIHLIGVVFTPRTLGVRVKLTPAQQLIFDEKDDSKAGRRSSASESEHISSSNIQNQIHKEIDEYNKAHKKHKKRHPNCKLKTGAMKDNTTIVFKRLRAPLSLRTPTSRAHITIGCASNVQAKQTGDDLVDLIDLEQRPSTSSSSSNFQQDFKLEGGVLRQFGKQSDAFVFYSDTDMIVPGLFNFFI